MTELEIDLLAACKAQHDAIDRLFAMLIIATRSDVPSEAGMQFMPSKSGQPWDAMVAGNAAIARAEGINRQTDADQPAAGDTDRMVRIDAMILHLQDIRQRFGNTCVYVRRGGLSWGAVALNRQADDKEHGVFDLQNQHDKDMAERVGQIDRLIADRNQWRDAQWQSEKDIAVLQARIAELEAAADDPAPIS